MLRTLKTKLASMRAAPTDIGGLLERIGGLREEIAILQIERETTAHAPRPPAEILMALDGWFDQAATDAVDRLGINRLTNRANPAGLELPYFIDPQTRHVDATMATKTLLGLLIASNREAIRDIVAGQLRDLCRDRPALTDEAQASRLAALDHQILSAEFAEESAIRCLEAAGVFIQRRPDAAPLAVLADDDALPQA